MIKKTFVVQSADPLNFNKYLDDKINEFQSQGLSVEIFLLYVNNLHSLFNLHTVRRA